MSLYSFPYTSPTKFEIHQVNFSGKIRDSPTSSILKTPTAIFVTNRKSSSKTKKLTFANGPIDLVTLKNGTYGSNVSSDSGVDGVEGKSKNNGNVSFDSSVVEVAISPSKTMEVSPETWKAFMEYKKYHDYPNETEKTDYTYSRLSKFRHKEIIPGFLVRPNLSRSSISSRRSSLSPSNYSSFSKSFQSDGYDFTVKNSTKSEEINDYKTYSDPEKFVRSKYYLRSGNTNWRDVTEPVSNSEYLEKEYYIHSPTETVSKSYSYSTSEQPEPNTYYYGKGKSMEYNDDGDIDEVDVNPIHSEKHCYSTSQMDSSGFYQPVTYSEYFKNFFTTVFLYITSVGAVTRDLFSKHILRRQDDWGQKHSSAYAWNAYAAKDSFYKSKGISSWVPWIGKSTYSTGSYYSSDYYGQPRTWYQKLYYYINDRFSQLTNLLWGSSSGYTSYRYRDTSRRRLWWLFIPLLLLAGSFLGYIDFFSNPKAILNTMYNWAVFVPTFIHYTIMVFIPWLIFEGLPYLVLKVIPNFILVTLPYFVLNTIPYYFWAVVHFFASLTLSNIWNMLVGALTFILNIGISSGLWLYGAERENGFLSNQYKNLDCMTNGMLTAVEDTIKPVLRSGYLAYKKSAASASCYVNDSWERLKLPFIHINERLREKLSSFSEGSLGFIFGIWTLLWQGLWNGLFFIRDVFSTFCFFLLDFFTNFINSIGNVLNYIFGNFTDSLFSIFKYLGWLVGSAYSFIADSLYELGSFLYLLFFAPKVQVKYEKVPQPSKEACMMQQKSIDKLSSEIEGFKSQTLDLSLLKKKIDDLEAEIKREKELRKSQDDVFDKQLDNHHKTLQKYQASVNHALFSCKRPAQNSGSSVHYLLNSQSDALKQWITQNFLLKSDSNDLDEEKVALLIAKYGNRTGEELLALKRELQMFVKSHKNDLEKLRNNFNTLETNNLGGGDVSLAFVKKLITDAIKLYDADKTGLVDYALETAGGQVLSIRCTETYMLSPKSYILMGWHVYTEATSPREALRPGMAAGQCWAFVGSQGHLVVQLSHTIRVTGFTMEHISKSLVPKGHIESAPKSFSMWGLRSVNDLEPYLFGEYVYLDNGETLQYFPVSYPANELHKIVELKIMSNHGNPNYTCLYRIRVHGDLEPMHY